MAVRLALRGAQLIMLVGITSLILAAITLLVFGGLETYRHIVKIASPGEPQLTNREVFLASIKLVDLVLLATVMQVVAFGLFAMFIDSDVPLPRWLRGGDVDSLKQMLAGIVAVMLGVLFLELVITGTGGQELLAAGLAIAAVILALSFFIRAHPPHH
jgi:uncharacterized membrane protein YqhA